MTRLPISKAPSSAGPCTRSASRSQRDGTPSPGGSRTRFEGRRTTQLRDGLRERVSRPSLHPSTLPLMVLKRVIPCLDVDSGRVVKGTNFVGLRDAGDPVELAERYDAEGADELIFLDITASSDQRDTIVDVVERTAEQVFIPFCVGGGIRSVEDARRL